MKEYTSKEIKVLKANPYTFKVIKSKLYFTAELKEIFWIGYQAGITPRKLLLDMDYDTEMFGQKQIDSIVQRIKKQAQNGYGSTQGENRNRRKKNESIKSVSNNSNEIDNKAGVFKSGNLTGTYNMGSVYYTLPLDFTGNVTINADGGMTQVTSKDNYADSDVTLTNDGQKWTAFVYAPSKFAKSADRKVYTYTDGTATNTFKLTLTG